MIGSEKVDVYKQYPNWIIMKRCNRGHLPYFTLHKKRRLFGFEWTGGVFKWGENIEKLEGFILRWEGFYND